MFEFLKKKASTEKEIYFGRTNEYMEYPTPAVTQVPEWYKEAPRFTHGNQPMMTNKDQDGNLGLKYCIPFLDTLTTGYIATLWQDMLVERTASGLSFTWANDPDIMSGRDGLGFETLPVPAGHGEKQYVWRQPFSVKVPEGYSVMYTHPLNRYDLPFTTLSGIHDSDSILPPGNFPFFMRDGFEGLIPRGTPLFQIIPFKREDWVAYGSSDVSKEGETRGLLSTTMLSGFYKKHMWKRKSYRMGSKK